MDSLVRSAAIGAAAIVGAQYLDAKLDIAHDVKLIKASVLARIRFGWSHVAADRGS
jgi:hypothetical protein